MKVQKNKIRRRTEEERTEEERTEEKKRNETIQRDAEAELQYSPRGGGTGTRTST